VPLHLIIRPQFSTGSVLKPFIRDHSKLEGRSVAVNALAEVSPMGLEFEVLISLIRFVSSRPEAVIHFL
jgi:hypothetical protein